MSETDRRNDNVPTSGLKSLGVVLSIVALIAGMSSIVRPIQQQIDMLHDRIKEIEIRAEKQVNGIDDKLQVEIEKAEKATSLENERNKARLEKLEDWQNWWHRKLLLGVKSPLVEKNVEEK